MTAPVRRQPPPRRLEALDREACLSLLPGETPGRADDRCRPGRLSVWLFIATVLVFLTVVVGGATRLTQSGLSMVRWEPVSGVVPPLTDADWQREFVAYQAHPEYQMVNRGMDLAEFKAIFLWEFAHRILGRLVGVVLAVPLIWWTLRRAIPTGYGRRLSGLVLLVALQGAIGWWMVASGLIDRPDVAHERLALHLITALALMVALLWTALDLWALAAGEDRAGRYPVRWLWPFMLLLFVQIAVGGLVAGLDAGRAFNTWPAMGDSWVPDRVTQLSPLWRNIVDNPATVQFVHRWLAAAVAVFALAIALGLWRAGATMQAAALASAVGLQFVLGVLTLLHAVPVPLGVAHQAGAGLLLATTVLAGHKATRTSRRGPRSAALAGGSCA